ncbi:MAG TPA: excinuclease ABC subunit UvrA [bacterium]|nr:excinuclease ABC subunit UvrA [bacterium]HOQ91500.1 excinuclease ABC subunit UvrA [bacterium]HPL22142.1 excinuclease ABC subunit UvrA [bacterium]
MTTKTVSQDWLKIRGARVNNLQNIDLDIPRGQLVVITGLSGSGKSSLAFDTIYAEGQRRYVESLSAYARQFLGLMDKPDVDLIEGLSPAISIDQKSASNNPRSTVGTITEIYDYLRLLYARIGQPHCPVCGDPIKANTVDEIVDQIIKQATGQKIAILSPLIRDKKGEHKNVLLAIARAGFSRVRWDNNLYDLEEAQNLTVDKQKKHNLSIVIDRLTINNDKSSYSRLTEAVDKALDLANGLVATLDLNQTEAEEKIYSQHFACPRCNINLPEIEPRNFSFNSPHGACPHCTGLGTKLEIIPELVFNNNLTIAQGAVRPWSHYGYSRQLWMTRVIGAVANEYGFDLNTPLNKLTAKQLDILMNGTGDLVYTLPSTAGMNQLNVKFEGVIPNLYQRYQQTESDFVRTEIEKYMRTIPCSVCHGQRLKPEFLAVKLAGQSIYELTEQTIAQNYTFFKQLIANKKLTAKQTQIGRLIFKEIISRLQFLLNVGLDYLSLNRPATTLSGGEAQRIRLATQIGSALTGVLYVLDEPSIGLHPKDNDKLTDTLKNLRDLGNSVLVVEHDKATMLAADHIIDVGPGAGKNGGQIIAQGTAKEIMANPKSLTGQYLSGKKSIPIPKKYRAGNGHYLTIIGARQNNLQNLTVNFPLGKFIAITGVSGSGKSTLVTDILARALKQKFYQALEDPGQHERIDGLQYINKIIETDQSPIGRTPRSNPATYTGAFTPIRDLFASLPEAKLRGYKSGRFSFNVTGGRCEACHGDGLVKIEMQFLPDVYVTCEVCHGQRYNQEALEIHYKGKNIYEILEMTIEEALEFFTNQPAIKDKLAALNEVGLGYIKLGQPATTLSGGEAQRVKLATELARKSTGKTLYILDEPTTGLHFADIHKLLEVLQQLVDKGNTVIVIEHNLDVIKTADWLIDLGPLGGQKGGQIIAEGTPLEIAANPQSFTGQYLKKSCQKVNKILTIPLKLPKLIKLNQISAIFISRKLL